MPLLSARCKLLFMRRRRRKSHSKRPSFLRILKCLTISAVWLWQILEQTTSTRSTMWSELKVTRSVDAEEMEHTTTNWCRTLRHVHRRSQRPQLRLKLNGVICPKRLSPPIPQARSAESAPAAALCKNCSDSRAWPQAFRISAGE